MRGAKQIWSALLVLILMLLTTGPGLARADNTGILTDGVRAYEAENWPEAVSAFQKLADSGIENGFLFYNLGNAHLKNGDIGHARLWYERALRLLPDNPDLNFNHAHVLTLIKDAPPEQGISVLRIIFFWNDLLLPATIRWLAILLNLALWTALVVLSIRKKRLRRPGILVLAAVTLIFGATAIFNTIHGARTHDGIVLPAELSVRSGFDDTDTRLFVLHAGAKVRITRMTDTHCLIRYADDKIGWVKKSDVGVI
ncbi:tetratricopeptide repeat protein [Desulfosarcina sp. OttesenSCG-928-B08]|nr:tetratricopeptide repeat protein [Desulfosarcina sp. OttesenSCG-928-B08]